MPSPPEPAASAGGVDPNRAVRGRAVRARRAEPCFYCEAPIAVGDRIYPVAYGRYGCAGCASDTELVKRRVSRPQPRSAPGYGRVCPVCDAQPGQACVTSSGKKRALHKQR